MPKHKMIWFLVGDGARARILCRSEQHSGYEVLAEFESAEALSLEHAVGEDRPGRVYESAASQHHAIEPRHDRQRIRKADFAREVAGYLSEACRAERFDALVLFAAPRSLPEYRAGLDSATRAKIAAEVPKDLAKLPVKELEGHFAPFG